LVLISTTYVGILKLASEAMVKCIYLMIIDAVLWRIVREVGA